VAVGTTTTTTTTSSPNKPSPSLLLLLLPQTEVSDKLYVCLHDDYSSSVVAGATEDFRCYLSELYDQFWDMCYLHKNLGLDVRIMYNGTRDDQGDKEEGLMKEEVQVGRRWWWW